ncbi:hypothetical protein AMATHDRAFT_64123 [Amanita thiersii Skay4041]|uniref:G-protein coupled receptors family 1 profile domain-containing protein n=1 Tax=Amanita thiersii Skay4041 TaxID=703135 RepID=A0A2A9NKV0_9AGAR|nr:hypothetical protein AMATHDRAFT_64123 [Amanita thiersii Skay4041]
MDAKTSLEIKITGLFVQAIMFGLYTASFLHMWSLALEDMKWRLRRDTSLLLLIIGTLIFIFNASDLIATLLSMLHMLRKDKHGGRIDILILDLVEILSMISVDGVLIYRCWIVNVRKWHFIYFPLILWLGNYCCFAYTTYLNVRSVVNRGAVPDLWYRKVHVLWAFYASTVVINIYSTTAITLRIWYSKARHRKNGFTKATIPFSIRIVAESGILYTTSSTMVMILWIIPASVKLDFVQSVVNGVSVPMVGIAFNLIFIRVACKRAGIEVVNKGVSWSRHIENGGSHTTSTGGGSDDKTDPIDIHEKV